MSLYDLLPPEDPMVPRGTLPPVPQMPAPDWQSMVLPNGQNQLYPGQADELPQSGDFFTRLATARGGQPFQAPSMGRKPTAAEIILGMAAAFGNFKTSMALSKTKEIEAKNERIRTAASDLAKRRHEIRKSKQLQDEIAARMMAQPIASVDAQGRPVYVPKGEAAGKPAPMPRPVATVGADGRPVLETTAGAVGKEPYYKPEAPGRLTGGPAGANTPEHWATMLETFQATMSQVPYGMRNQVVDMLAARGSTVIPKPARDAVQSMNGGLTIVDELEALSKKVPRGEGVRRFAQGARNVVGAFTQTNPDAAEYDRLRTNLSNLARAMGERGVLTNQDIDRILKSIPDLGTSGTLEKRQFATLRRLMEGFKERSIQAYTTANPSGATGATSTVKMQKNGKTYSIPPDKVAEAEADGLVRVP